MILSSGVEKMFNREMIFKIGKYLKEYRVHIVLSFLFSILSVTTSLYIPILFGNGIDLIIDYKNVDIEGIKDIFVKIILLFSISATAQYVMSIINNRISFGIIKGLRKKAFEKTNKLPVSYLDSKGTGEIVSRVINDTDQFAEGLLMGFNQFFSGVVSIIVTIIYMVTINYKIALVVILLTPISLFLAKFIASKTYSMFKRQSEIKGEITGLIDETLGNLKVVKAYEHEEENIKVFEKINRDLEKASLDAIFYSAITHPLTRFVNGIVYTGVTFFGAILSVGGGISIGKLASFLSYANQYTKPFNEISGVLSEIQNAFSSAVRVIEILEEDEEDEKGSDEIIDLCGNVSFENVTFSYGNKEPVIKDLNLTLNKGDTIAIVGPTGSGKTTLINLLMRFYEVNSGTIKIDGIDINKIKRNRLRDNFGMVLQDTFIKAGTVKENILMGKYNATDEEIVNAAKKSNAHSFIKKLSKGYDTVLGENGNGLSEGQKQLLCVTRVMLSKPPLLILDEATSSVDTRTEGKIQKSFEALMEGRTSFIVAHRLKTIINADIILVMKDGKVVECGNHQQLMGRRGFYFEMFESQWQ